MGTEKENESRGNRQQMNLHLCSEASRDSSEKTCQTTTDVLLWVYLSEGTFLRIAIRVFCRGRSATRLCNNELGMSGINQLLHKCRAIQLLQ